MKSRNIKGREKVIHCPREEEKIITVRITRRKEEQKGEKCKEDENKENQEKEGIEIEPRLEKNPFIQ